LFAQDKPIGVGCVGDDQHSEGDKFFHSGKGLIKKAKQFKAAPR
jgi:hypothetical protein